MGKNYSLNIFLISKNNYNYDILEGIYGIKSYKRYFTKEINFDNYEYDNKYKLLMSRDEINGWKFYRFSPGINNEQLKLIVNIFDYKIKNLDNSDKKNNKEYHEFSDKNSHNIIIYFTDDKDENDIKLLYDLGQTLPKSHLPFIIFVSNSKDKNYYDNYIKSTSDEEKRFVYDYLNIYFVSLGETTTKEILKILWGRTCYYNELEDKENSLLNYERDISTDMCLNMMIFGLAGVGKSSFINEVKGEKIALEGVGKIVTSRITKYKIIKKFQVQEKEIHGQINIIDCPGFTIKGKEMELAEKEINKLFKDLTNSRNFIHCVLYVVNAKTKRSLSPEEILFIRRIRNQLIDKNGSSKILFILNFLKKKTKNKESFKNILIQQLNQEFPNSFSSKDIIELNLKSDYDHDTKQWGLKEVFANLFKFFMLHKIDIKKIKDNMSFNELKEYLIPSMFFKFISLQTELLEKLKITCQKTIDDETTSVKDVSWDFFDTEKIERSRKRMLTNIQSEFGLGISFYKSDYQLTSDEKMYSNIKFIPIIGTIIGGYNMSEKSPKITREIGQKFLEKNIEEFEKNLHSTKNYLSSITFYNNSVDLLENLSKTLN